MDGFNKVISFVLGLVVVIVFLAIISGKIDLRKRIAGISTTKTTSTGFSLFGSKPTTTPTPTITPTQKPTTTYNQYNNQNSNKTSQTPKKIPNTGSPTIIIPLLFSSLAGGVYLRKKN